MQLILETETSNIEIKDKMSTLEQESLSEKLIVNGNIIKAPSEDVPNGHKENIIAKNNIVNDCKESVSLNHDKETLAEDIPTQATATGDASTAEIKVPEVHYNAVNENLVSNIDNSISENTEKKKFKSDKKDNEESHSDIVSETKFNKVDQLLVSIEIEKENASSCKIIEISEGKVKEDVRMQQEKCIERKESQFVAKDEEKNKLKQRVDIEKEVEMVKINKLEQDFKEVDNLDQEITKVADEKMNENVSQKENLTEKGSDLRGEMTEYEANSVNTESSDVNESVDKNDSSTKTFLECGDQTEISITGSNEDTRRYDNSVNKAPSENSPLDCGDQPETPAIEIDQDTQSTNDTVNEVPSEITKTSLNCGNQTEVVALGSNQDAQSYNDAVDKLPSEITKTPLDSGTHTETPAIESSQVTRSNNNDVDEVSSEIDYVSDCLMDCDESDTITGISKDNTDSSIDCDKVKEVATSDVDIVTQTTNKGNLDISMDCDKTMEVTTNDFDVALVPSKDKLDISMECDEVMEVATSVVEIVAEIPSKDNVDISVDCNEAIEVAQSDVDIVTQMPSKDNVDIPVNCDKAMKVSTSEVNIVAQMPSKENADTSIVCDKAIEVAASNVEIVAQISSGDNVDIPVDCDKAMEVAQSEVDIVAEMPSKDNGDISMDCNKAIKESTSEVDIAAQMPVKCVEITKATAKVMGTVLAVDCNNITNTNVNEIIDVIHSIPDNDKVSKIPDEIVESGEGKDILPDILPVTEEATSHKNDVIEIPVTETITEILDVDEIKVISDKKEEPIHKPEPPSQPEKKTPTICRLSNTLNILSDDEDEPMVEKQCQNSETVSTDKQCINIEDDDDIMVIDEDTPSKEDSKVTTLAAADNNKDDSEQKSENSSSRSIDSKDNESCEESLTINEKESSVPETGFSESIAGPEISEKLTENIIDKLEMPDVKTKQDKLLPDNFFKSYKKNLADMTRDDLEEFCILKIVESIIDRSNLTEIRSKIKNMGQHIEEYKKKATMLTKQNRDLQLVLKSVQEEQKKAGDSPITPLKITRSVGMQVLMTDKNARRKGIATAVNNTGPNVNNRPTRNALNQNPRQHPQQNNSQQIPVPRLVPATSTNNTLVNKTPNTGPQVSSAKNAGKNASPLPNGIRVTQPQQKSAEKRPHNKMLTVDLTDDEPPSKVPAKIAPAPPVRLVPPQNLLAPRQPLSQPVNSPRKVYIPIGGPQGQNVRPGQTIMLKSVPSPGPRQRGPIAPMVRLPQNSVRIGRVQSSRHPAPLPESMKQYQPPNWKALPPAPDLKLSKVENGIVISWKIEGYQEDSYEEIASYQLYAYQETSSPPNTSLWKKIGDVKALPLPMACTLTQFMAGYKYYFAVRSVDVKSRLGPFSLPGSILLLNKM